MNAPRLFIQAFLTLLLGASCTKFPFPTTGPIPGSLPATPFQTWLDSAMNLGGDSLGLTLNPVGLYDQLKAGPGAPVPGQAEVAYAFRSVDSGYVVELGVLLPDSGFEHTVTLWDSTTGTVLAQANVPTFISGQWGYVDLALTNAQVAIRPNHGYLVGFNTLAVGNTIDGSFTGNLMYFLSGFYDYKSSIPAPGEWLPIFPFTENGITFEGSYMTYYDTPLASFFPQGSAYPGITPGAIGINQTPGGCDIGFIPQP